MSRKNRRLGEEWLEEHFDLFCRHKWYSVKKYYMAPAGPFWAPYSHHECKKMEVERFETLGEYKAWRRGRMKKKWRNLRIFERHGVKMSIQSEVLDLIDFVESPRGEP